MPLGTTLRDAIASLLLLCNGDKLYWPVPLTLDEGMREI